VTASVSYDSVHVGTELPVRSFPLQRVNLVMYAGVSGDFNVIHWNERAATSVGLTNVIAHGMLTMAEAGRVLTDWVGDPAAVVEYHARFTRVVVVPDDGTGALLEVTGKVTELLDGRRVRVELSATAAGDKVLGQARAVVQLA
jgi:acyl dehydratase